MAGPALHLVGAHETPPYPPGPAAATDWIKLRHAACPTLRSLRALLRNSPDPLDQQLLAAIDRYLEGDLA